jgi:hypothetical protein
MKYNLRSLMLFVTLVCVVLGGRIEYLRLWAVFHEELAYTRGVGTMLNCKVLRA